MLSLVIRGVLSVLVHFVLEVAQLLQRIPLSESRDGEQPGDTRVKVWQIQWASRGLNLAGPMRWHMC